MAKLLVWYATHEGQTRKILERMVSSYPGYDVEWCRLDAEPSVALSMYDKVLVGASIRYGVFQPALHRFVKKHTAILNKLPGAFYSVNLVARKPEKRTPQTNSYARKFLMSSPWRPDHSAVIAGALLYPRYRWYDRVMIQLIMKMSGGETDTNKEVVYTDWEQVARFAREIAQLTNKTSLK